MWNRVRFLMGCCRAATRPAAQQLRKPTATPRKTGNGRRARRDRNVGGLSTLMGESECLVDEWFQRHAHAVERVVHYHSRCDADGEPQTPDGNATNDHGSTPFAVGPP